MAQKDKKRYKGKTARKAETLPFVKENYNAGLSLGKGNNISIKRSISIEGNNNVVKDSQSKYNESKSGNNQKEYLLNRVIELEDEVKKLKGKKK